MEGSQIYIGTPCGLVVCVDRAAGQSITGRYYHCCSREGERFHSLEELVFGMERFFDSLKFPYPAQSRRGFAGVRKEQRNDDEAPLGRNSMRREPRNQIEERRRVMDEEELLKQHGDLGTFIVRVQHRQNSSWQGRITWADQNKTVNFRSIWEMVRLIGDALDMVGGPEGQEARWPEE